MLLVLQKATLLLVLQVAVHAQHSMAEQCLSQEMSQQSSSRTSAGQAYQGLLNCKEAHCCWSCKQAGLAAAHCTL